MNDEYIDNVMEDYDELLEQGYKEDEAFKILEVSALRNISIEINHLTSNLH